MASTFTFDPEHVASFKKDSGKGVGLPGGAVSGVGREVPCTPEKRAKTAGLGLENGQNLQNVFNLQNFGNLVKNEGISTPKYKSKRIPANLVINEQAKVS